MIRSLPNSRTCLPLLVVSLLSMSACAVGPDFVKPQPPAPAGWSDWHGGDDSTRWPSAAAEGLVPDWWRAFDDPVLDALEQRALANAPDLATAALHLAQARAQRVQQGAQAAPQVDLDASAIRQRQSENGASTRLYDAIGSGAAGADSQQLRALLSQPFTLYDTSVSASWEPDLWGRIRRSLEAADADVAEQAALLAQTRLTLASEVASQYLSLRTTQRRLQAMRESVDALQAHYTLMQARAEAGQISQADLQSQQGELAASQAAVPALAAQEGSIANQLGLLLGARPGELAGQLRPLDAPGQATLPALALGLPSDLARRRPDILAAEARLHQATASIGVARADLYPSIRLTGQFGYDTYQSGALGDWASRAWSVGPSLNLPLFDLGKRKAVVQLRELQQQEAAVAYQQTVLKAWQEIDDALSDYRAQQQTLDRQQVRVDSTGATYALSRTRYDAGLVDFLAVLEAQRSDLQARQELIATQGQRDAAFVRVNRVIGNLPPDPAAAPADGPASRP